MIIANKVFEVIMRFFSTLLFLFLLPLFGNTQGLKLPYPIIFVHGLDSDYKTWEEMMYYMKFNFGVTSYNSGESVLHFIPNAYGNLRSIEGPDGIYGTTDDDVLFLTLDDNGNTVNTISNGNLYLVNFKNFWNKDAENPRIKILDGGSPTFGGIGESDGNESAIIKQGYALKIAINKVLAATGAERVILVGHSMGGLAIREYLQRTDENGSPKWWVNKEDISEGHKVAKVVTIGTPHLGSNLFENLSIYGKKSNSDKNPLKTNIPDVNLFSEAIRDLRYNYNDLGLQGRYLFGGTENAGDWYTFGFHNFDVNCDGDQLDLVVGINEGEDGTIDNPSMKLPVTNINYIWITSDDHTWVYENGGDWVVNLHRQWLHKNNKSYPLNISDTLLTDKAHWNETSDCLTLLRGIDEPELKESAFPIQLGVRYSGNITPKYSGINIDTDCFKFSLTKNTHLSFFLNKFNPEEENAGLTGFEILKYLNNEIVYKATLIDGSFSDSLPAIIPSGDYVLKILGSSENKTGIGGYIFEVKEKSSTYEPNNTQAEGTLIAVGLDGQTHQIENGNDVDWLKFNAVAGYGYRIQLLEETGVNVETRLYNEQGSQIGGAWGEDGWILSPVNGQLYIRVSRSSYSADMGYYRIRVIPSFWNTSPSLSWDEWMEPNNSEKEAFPVSAPGQVIEGKFDGSNPSDWIQIKPQVNNIYTITILEESGVDVRFNIFYATNSQMSYSAIKTGINSSYDFTPLVSGTYLLQFYQNGNNIGKYSYSISGGVLPVELSEMKCFQTGNHVMLRWTTISETNNAGFEIEIFDSSLSTPDWKKVGYVSGLGTTTQEVKYEFSYKLTGKQNRLDLRLVQLDLDGTRKMLREIEFKVDEHENVFFGALYPNPTNGSITIPFYFPERSAIEIKVINILGQVIKTTQLGVEKGYSEYQFHDPVISSGTYFIIATELGSKKVLSKQKIVFIN
ncbi:MAG: T9SS type A sorting domain-containing protein [Bacteroidetes bacterium]|nr:T9SS type A sorting domain-containing protein [Bacteroidota bacterium]